MQSIRFGDANMKPTWPFDGLKWSTNLNDRLDGLVVDLFLKCRLTWSKKCALITLLGDSLSTQNAGMNLFVDM